jgi:hypothetical protein
MMFLLGLVVYKLELKTEAAPKRLVEILRTSREMLLDPMSPKTPISRAFSQKCLNLQ